MRSPLRKNAILFTAIAGVVATWSGAASAITFPLETAWVPLTKGGAPIGDPVGDGVNERDIVGDATHPAAYVYQDATNLYFRLRLNKQPTKTDLTFSPFGWGCGIDANNSASSLEFWASVNGIENTGPDGNPDQVEYWWNQTVDTDKIDDQLEVLVSKFAATQPLGYARSVLAAGSMFGGDPDYFIDWAIPLATMRAGGMGAPGIPAGTSLRFACGSSSNARRMDADPLGPSDATTLTGIFSDPVLCTSTGCVSDRDGDGIADSIEPTLGTDPAKADTDGDGIPDNVETSATGGMGPFSKIDTDSDGTIDALDTDSDGDTILDGADGTADVDGDGKANFRDTDSDNDTRLDKDEKTIDTDGDGKGNYVDLDSDNDCVPDQTETAEGYLDPTKPNASANANCPMGETCNTKTGICSGAAGDAGTDAGSPTDRDGDGVPNADEVMLGTDPDKADSDGDGILDGVELSTSGSTGPFTKIDTDGDGTIDALDTDSDGDGVADGTDGTGDVDGDGKPNFRDADSAGSPDAGGVSDGGVSADDPGGSVEGGAGACAFGGSNGGSALGLIAAAALAAASVRRRRR